MVLSSLSSNFHEPIRWTHGSFNYRVIVATLSFPAGLLSNKDPVFQLFIGHCFNCWLLFYSKWQIVMGLLLKPKPLLLKKIVLFVFIFQVDLCSYSCVSSREKNICYPMCPELFQWFNRWVIWITLILFYFIYVFLFHRWRKEWRNCPFIPRFHGPDHGVHNTSCYH